MLDFAQSQYLADPDLVVRNFVDQDLVVQSLPDRDLVDRNLVDRILIIVVVVVAAAAAAAAAVVVVDSADLRTVVVHSEAVEDSNMVAVFVLEALADHIAELGSAGLGTLGVLIDLVGPEAVLAFAVVETAEGTAADTLEVPVAQKQAVLAKDSPAAPAEAVDILEVPVAREQAALAKDSLAVPAEAADILELAAETVALGSESGQLVPAGLFQLEQWVQKNLPRQKVVRLRRQGLNCLQRGTGKPYLKLQ